MKSETSNESVYDITIRMVIILLIVGWCLLLMYPFVSVILWSLILAMALYPLHTSLSKKLGWKTKMGFIYHNWCYIDNCNSSYLLNGWLIDCGS